MNRPDFAEVERLIGLLSELDTGFAGLFEKTERMKMEAREAGKAWLLHASTDSLSGISLEELEASMRAQQLKALKDAGYHNLKDLYQVPDAELLSIPGVGEKTVAVIRAAQDEFLRVLAKRKGIVLDPAAQDALTRDLITKLCFFLQADRIRKDAEAIRQELPAEIKNRIEKVKLRNGFRWFFSRKSTKEDTILGIASLLQFLKSPLYTRAVHFLSAFQKLGEIDEDQAVEDFTKNSAAYYALLESLSLSRVPESFVYHSIPAKLAAEIREEPLELESFHGNLRAYQDFGTRYILHQKRVLLGDEMGLGKTIQAIAAMTHLDRAAPGCHFLVVCPASVMINWCREIRRFSDLPAALIHGENRDREFARWKEKGGAAVTSYEGMDRIVGEIDRKMSLSLFVVDEAHYIKNPEAKRSRNIHRLDEESERILLMTGTPLENRVDEMCELIGFIRPDLSGEIRKNALLRNLPEFKELLAPAYLRRLREQVLPELPPLTVEDEWCEMTKEDRESYIREVEARQFMAMRRVSFLQEDMGSSAKAGRLRELCQAALDEGRKVVVYSGFLEIIRKAEAVLSDLEPGVITGSIPIPERQRILDRFSETSASGGGVLICQIQAGGTGLNLQAASVVIFCEPQIKPSLTRQATSRVYRMGQLKNVLIFHLLCENSIDEAIQKLSEGKEKEFDLFAEESALAEAADSMPDSEWIRDIVEKERQKYLPALVQ